MVVCGMKANGSKVSLFESDLVEQILFGCTTEKISLRASRKASEDYQFHPIVFYVHRTHASIRARILVIID